jgi:hypothetical protein
VCTQRRSSTCPKVDGAQRELDYLRDNDVKVALIKPGPVNGIRGWRSPALPEFGPCSRDVEAAGLPIVLHASYPPLDDYVAKWEPPHTQNFMAQSAFRWMVLGHLYKKMPQNFAEHPHDVFRRNIWVSPFWEGCVAEVVRRFMGLPIAKPDPAAVKPPAMANA